MMRQHLLQRAHVHRCWCMAGFQPQELERHPSAAEAVEAYGLQTEQGAYRGPNAGATACVALVRGNQLCVASVGDSR